MNVEDLQEELMQLGRRPVPGPRPEFVETLLARIQLPDEAARLAPVLPLSARRPLLRRTVMLGAAGALAAASLAAVAISNVQDSGPSSVQAQAISGQDYVGRYKADLAAMSGKRAVPCPPDAISVVLSGAETPITWPCQPGMEIQVTLDRGRITYGPKLVAAARFGLRSAPEKQAVTLDWDAYTGPNFGSYLVLRRHGDEAPSYPSEDVPVLSSTDQSRTTFVEPIVEAFPDHEASVSYLVVVLDAAGKQISRSIAVKVPIEWTGKASTNG